MKLKLLFLLFILPFISCNNESDQIIDDRLDQSVWYNYNLPISFGYEEYMVLDFISDTRVKKYQIRDGNVSVYYGTYDYSLNYPNLVIDFINDTGEVCKFYYLFEDDDKLVSKDLESSAMSYEEFIKQD